MNLYSIHRREHWEVLFKLLEVIGAAAFIKNARLALEIHSDNEEGGGGAGAERLHNDSDRGYSSDAEIYEKKSGSVGRAGSAEWTVVGNDGEIQQFRPTSNPPKPTLIPFDPEVLVLNKNLHTHDPKAFLKCCETLAFIVRDAAHITPENFSACVKCVRTFIEASINGGKFKRPKAPPALDDPQAKNRRQPRKKRSPEESGSGSLSEEEDYSKKLNQLMAEYDQASLQLLDLAHTLHTKAGEIHSRWKQYYTDLDTCSRTMWANCWSPLLQALSRMCCDRRSQIRMAALNHYLL